MFFQLDDFGIRLQVADQTLNRYFSQLLQGWLAEPSVDPLSLVGTGGATVEFDLVDRLPARPQAKPLFSTATSSLPTMSVSLKFMRVMRRTGSIFQTTLQSS